jgi:hypothetical protein
MKGQMFLILSIVIIVLIAMLKSGLNLNNIMQNQQYMESGLERIEFQNIKDEMGKSIQICYSQGNMSDCLDDFFKFSKNSLNARAVDFTGYLVKSSYSYPEINSQLNVSVFNGFDTEMNTLNLTLNGSSQIFGSIQGVSSISTTFSVSTDSNYVLTVFYNTSYENKTDSVAIPISSGKGKLITFFDLRMASNRVEYRDKFTDTVTLP